jgi:hypothetical protein
MVRQVIALVKLAMMRTEDLLKGRRPILGEVQSVGDLSGFGGSLPHAGGIGCGAVTGDDRDVGMGLKPRGHGFSRAIFQHINGTTPLEIDHDGAVALALAPRPLIPPNDFRCWPLGQRHAAHASQEGIAAP